MMGMSRRQRLAYFLRKIHLLNYANYIWFVRQYFISRRSNRHFRLLNPDLPVPPLWMLYDIQGNCSLPGYFQSGRDQAAEISRIISTERPGTPLKVLEWGCGPARVLQHIKPIDGNVWELWGSDYSQGAISWCRQNWKQIRFIQNGLGPPIDAEDASFDVIYCISVFTHLSEVRHFQWISELMRLLKPGGLFVGTFHGEGYRDSLTDSEQRQFDVGELVIRDNIREGKRDYSAYHCEPFVRKLLAGFVDVRMLCGIPGFSQSVWIATKNESGGDSTHVSAFRNDNCE